MRFTSQTGPRHDGTLDQLASSPADLIQVGGSVDECLERPGRYVESGARHLILRIGSLDAHPDVLADRLLPQLRKLAPAG
jgi:hypothetical protein